MSTDLANQYILKIRYLYYNSRGVCTPLSLPPPEYAHDRVPYPPPLSTGDHSFTPFCQGAPAFTPFAPHFNSTRIYINTKNFEFFLGQIVPRCYD